MNLYEYALDDDIAAVATALAPAAISVLRTSGRDAFKKCAAIFSRPKKLLESKGNELIHGWILEQGKKIDEVVLCAYRSPKSFTGEDSVEIMCHGGVSVTLAILNLLLRSGFRQARTGEFTFRSFISGKTDLTKAEAVKEIIDAKTAKAAENAASRLSGVLAEKLEQAKRCILYAIAELEVKIEYPEDDGSDEASSIHTEKISDAMSILESVTKHWNIQKIYSDGAKVVLAGKPNAGKSRLFNAIINEERAIVSDIAGTTRDWLETDCNFGGLPIKLYDTAGLRFTNEHIEKLGIDKTKHLSEAADLILYLADGTREPDTEDFEFLTADKYAGIPKILVFTKQDLLVGESADVSVSASAEKLLQAKIIDATVAISAATHFGIDTLVDKCFSLLVQGEGTAETVTVGTQRQKTAVERATGFLQHALQSAAANMPVDAVVLDMEEALHFIGELTGELKSDDILGEIFSNFCVGK